MKPERKDTITWLTGTLYLCQIQNDISSTYSIAWSTSQWERKDLNDKHDKWQIKWTFSYNQLFFLLIRIQMKKRQKGNQTCFISGIGSTKIPQLIAKKQSYLKLVSSFNLIVSSSLSSATLSSWTAASLQVFWTDLRNICLCQGGRLSVWLTKSVW